MTQQKDFNGDETARNSKTKSRSSSIHHHHIFMMITMMMLYELHSEFLWKILSLNIESWNPSLFLSWWNYFRWHNLNTCTITLGKVTRKHALSVDLLLTHRVDAFKEVKWMLRNFNFSAGGIPFPGNSVNRSCHQKGRLTLLWDETSLSTSRGSLGPLAKVFYAGAA